MDASTIALLDSVTPARIDEDRLWENRPMTMEPTRTSPRLGCAGIVRRADQVLLGQRNKDPNRGLWVLPGGGIQFGETFAETLARELAEEAGIEVEIGDVFNVTEILNPPHEHRVVVYLNARHCGGQPVASSDLSEVRFFTSDELQSMSRARLISPAVETILRKAALL